MTWRRGFWVQYRGKLLVSPNPMVRPTHGPYNMNVLDLFPRRSEALTAKLVKLMEWFLHTVLLLTS